MLALGKIQAGYQIKFSYQVPQSGEYVMECDFLGRKQTITTTLALGDYLIFDTSSLNENYEYSAIIRDPQGHLITFSDTDNINHTALGFETKVGYYNMSLADAQLSSVVVSTQAQNETVENLPLEWTSDLQTGQVWTVSYGGNIRNEGVELESVIDENGNDITNHVETVTTARDTQIIDVEFDQSVTGRLELISNG